jgi:hypothetical protein
MNGQVRLTRIGAVLMVVLVLALVALFVGSSTLQAIGFVVALIVILVLVADRLPRMRVGGGHDLGLDPQTLRRRSPAERAARDDVERR